jgi:hypothetical protein
VDGFVFWTKNLGPFVDTLAEVQRRGFPFVVSYSINGYPRALEAAVVDACRAVQHMRQVAAAYGPRAAVWRYDTLVFTSLTPPDFHRANFERLARELAGTTDEVVISFAQIYRKTRRSLTWAGEMYGFTWYDPDDETKRALTADLAGIAQANGMRLTVCGQRDYLLPGVEDAHCVDAVRLSDVAGRPIAARTRGHRDGCGCFASRDIGAYDTCPHGCVYCYAVQNRSMAQARWQMHDVMGESLV